MTLSTVTNGNTIFATDINQIVNEVNNMAGDTGSVVLNGSTTGTATLYQCFQYTFKMAVVVLANFRNGSAPAQTLALPVAFTKSVFGWSGGVGTHQVLLSSVAQSVGQLITLTAGANNSVSPQTTLHENWIWRCETGIDTVSFAGSDASTHNDLIVMIGV